MRFLVDASMSPVVVQVLREAGHDAVHVGEVLRLDVADEEILEHAAREGQVIVAADTGFGDLLARRQVAAPSVVLFHRQSGRRPRDQAALLLANLGPVEGDLREGAIVVVEERRVRVRALPITDPRAGGARSHCFRARSQRSLRRAQRRCGHQVTSRFCGASCHREALTR